MLQYIENVSVPYVEAVRETIDNEDAPALVIMDNFKGQVTSKVNNFLEENRIHVCLLPSNMTDRLQPLHTSVNKPAKEFLKQKFQDWYSLKVIEQIEDEEDIDFVEISPVDLSLPTLKEIGAEWLVEMSEYISNNPMFIVNGSIWAVITKAIHVDGIIEDSSDSEGDISSDCESEYTSND